MTANSTAKGITWAVRFMAAALVLALAYVLMKTVITYTCLLYTSPSPRDATLSRMPSSA